MLKYRIFRELVDNFIDLYLYEIQDKYESLKESGLSFEETFVYAFYFVLDRYYPVDCNPFEIGIDKRELGGAVHTVNDIFDESSDCIV